MMPRLSALLIHGLGSRAAWWEPFLPSFRFLGIQPLPLEMPSLEASGPEAWVARLREHAKGVALTLGHSLGAAVALDAARAAAFDAVVLLGMPTINGAVAPEPPQDTGLSATALARVGRFIRRLNESPPALTAETVQVVADGDPHVVADCARKLPYPLHILPGAGHDLSRPSSVVAQVLGIVARLEVVRRACDPGARALSFAEFPANPAAACQLNGEAPSPVRLDVEVTNRCQLACVRCARPRYRAGSPALDLDFARFEAMLLAFPHLREVFFVGLGEPLLHPRLEEYVAVARQRDLRCKVVTNGLLATPDRLTRLRDCGLAEITFSLDTLDAGLFRQLRGGASVSTVLEHFRGVPAGLLRTVFVTVSKHNLDSLPALIDFAAEMKLAGLAMSDVNFPHNQADSLAAHGASGRLTELLRRAREHRLVMVGPRFHDVGLHPRALPHIRVQSPADLTERSEHHRHCLAPWRIVVLNADGSLSPCNCAPDVLIPAESPAAVWNGNALRAWRQAMIAAQSPACLSCPRY
jgi:MoaA/NifB/PqqE/SkfB family radical SAM enzyme